MHRMSHKTAERADVVDENTIRDKLPIRVTSPRAALVETGLPTGRSEAETKVPIKEIQLRAEFSMKTIQKRDFLSDDEMPIDLSDDDN
jgi:hypothetical protein